MVTVKLAFEYEESETSFADLINKIVPKGKFTHQLNETWYKHGRTLYYQNLCSSDEIT